MKVYIQVLECGKQFEVSFESGQRYGTFSVNYTLDSNFIGHPWWMQEDSFLHDVRKAVAHNAMNLAMGEYKPTKWPHDTGPTVAVGNASKGHSHYNNGPTQWNSTLVQFKK